MKKLTAIICAIAMVFSFGVNAFAEEITQEVAISVTNNKPLDYLLALDDTVDWVSLAESLTNSTITMNTVQNSSDDKLAAELYSEGNIKLPIRFSESFSVNVDLATKMWVQLDLKNADNMKYNIIMQNPLNGKYIVIDYFKLLEQTDAETSKAIKEMFAELSKADIDADNEKLTKSFEDVVAKYAKTTVENNVTTIAVSKSSLSAILCDVAKISLDYVKTMSDDESFQISDEDMAEVKTQMDSVFALIFADDALTITKTKGATENDEQVSCNMHFAINLTDIAGVQIEGYTKEELVADFNLIVNVKSANSQKGIVFPTLTEQNSVDIMQLMAPTLTTGEETATYEEEYFWDYAMAEIVDMTTEKIYVDIADFFSNTMYDSDSLNGEVYIDENGNFTITAKSDTAETVVTGKVGESTYTVNGADYTAAQPFKNGDTLLVDVSVLKQLFDVSVESIELSYYKDGENFTTDAHVSVARPNGAYVAK